MFKTKFGYYRVMCDQCRDYYDTDEVTESDAWTEARTVGWTRKYDSDTRKYEYFCPDCE